MHLVLLPGMMCDARLFAPQTAALSGRVSLHFPTMATRNTVAGLAAEVLAGAPPRFALLGLSMGGIIAMEVVRQAPERVSHLALLDTNPLAEHADVRVRRVAQMAAVRAGQLDTVMREEMKPNYLASGEGRTAILDLCLDMALGLGPDAFIRQSEALMARPDQTETLRNYNGPSLVMCGAEDRLCPPERHELMANLLPNANLAVVAGAGHLPVLEKPEKVNAALCKWLAR